LLTLYHVVSLYLVDVRIVQTAYMGAWKNTKKTARTNLPEDEHLVVRNMSKTIQFNY